MKILIVYDRENWILHYIAEVIVQELHPHVDCIESTSVSIGKKKFLQLSKKYDTVHFLSEFDFFWLGRHSKAANVVNINHLYHNIAEQMIANKDSINGVCLLNQKYLIESLPLFGFSYVPFFVLDVPLDCESYKHLSQGREYIESRVKKKASRYIGFSGKPSSGLDRKGISRYWCLLEHLLNRYDIHLIITGPGGENGWNYATHVPEHLQLHCTLLTDIPDNEMPLFFSGLDYYICLSDAEGVPYPLIEAMACETKVITFPVGVAEEVIKNACNGYIVQPDTYIDSIASIVAADPKEQSCIMKNARKAVKAKFAQSGFLERNKFEYFYRLVLEHYE